MAGLPCQIDRLNNGQNEKKRKEGCEELKTIEAIVYHRRNALKENEVNQAHTESDNTCQGRAGNRHDQILAKNMYGKLVSGMCYISSGAIIGTVLPLFFVTDTF